MMAQTPSIWFQSTHPRGVRRTDRHSTRDSRSFQSTHPRGVRPPDFSFLQDVGQFQSTHPRGVRLQQVQHIPAQRLVSIHAPAWGATLFNITDELSYGGFNPRTRVGCDVTASTLLPSEWQFQSTHPRGVRRDPFVKDFTGRSWFQSTHPRGVRLYVILVGCSVTKFQSTHPRGVRHEWYRDQDLEAEVSIHAPAWGATSTDDDRAGMFSWVSIHAPAWGATDTWMMGEAGVRARFNPRTRVGCDLRPGWR